MLLLLLLIILFMPTRKIQWQMNSSTVCLHLCKIFDGRMQISQLIAIKLHSSDEYFDIRMKFQDHNRCCTNNLYHILCRLKKIRCASLHTCSMMNQIQIKSMNVFLHITILRCCDSNLNCVFDRKKTNKKKYLILFWLVMTDALNTKYTYVIKKIMLMFSLFFGKQNNTLNQ